MSSEPSSEVSLDTNPEGQAEATPMADDASSRSSPAVSAAPDASEHGREAAVGEAPVGPEAQVGPEGIEVPEPAKASPNGAVGPASAEDQTEDQTGDQAGEKPGHQGSVQAAAGGTPSAAAAPKAAAAPVKEAAAGPAPVSVPLLTLASASVSRDLVTLRRDSAALTAPYERVAGRVLGRPWRRTSLFFTSTHADEGSTAVAVNVATMLSRRTTKSVLLVELQLTEPSLWSLFGRPRVAAGLEEALRGRVAFESCLCEIGGEKLDVLMVKDAMRVEEIDHLSGALNDFLEWAEERFEWLVVDCPPVLAASWTRWFDLNADPVVLVAGSATTKKRELRKVAQRLGDRLAGTILNENRTTRRAS